MKKYVIISGLNASELENKVIDHIEKGYEPCGGVSITILAGGAIVMNQALWLNSYAVTTCQSSTYTFDDILELGKEKMKDGS